MPCKPGNSPTERMGFVLEDLLELEQYADELVELILKHAPSIAADIPRKPLLPAIIHERARRQFTLKEIDRVKKAVRRTRYRQNYGANIRGRKEYDSSMDQDIESGLSDQTKADLEKLLGEDK